ncbi:MAG: hypothetical protein FJ352_04035, partial [Firmicutes bacterium]|nr:hypothetical protein [Bacillota bacterium]
MRLYLITMDDNLENAIRKIVREILEKDVVAARPRAYGAPEGSKRDKQLDMTKADLESGDPERIQRAYNRREKMEKG